MVVGRVSSFLSPGGRKSHLGCCRVLLASLAFWGCSDPKAQTSQEPSSEESSESSEPEDEGSDNEKKSGDSDDKGSSDAPKGKTDSSKDKPSTEDKDTGNKDPGDDEEEPGDPDIKFDLGDTPDAKNDKKNELRPCEIDFLFVVDNSISMDSKQVNLINSVPKFIDTMMTSTELEKDFHIGVVTTDAYKHSPAQCRFLGGLISQVEMEVKQPNGTTLPKVVKCGPYKTGRNYMTHEDDLKRSFACAARPGRMGSVNERQIGALLAAVDPKHGAKGKCNEGFVREEALLVAVIITDEDDMEEKGAPADWHKKLLALKGNDPKKVVMVSIVVPKKNVCEPGDILSIVGKKLIEFTGLFPKRGFVGDVCSPSYDKIFKDAVGVVDFACGELVEPEG